jgi:hypothetical protein
LIFVATLRLKKRGHLRRRMGAEAASVAKGDLRQGDFCSRPREDASDNSGEEHRRNRK